MTATKICSPERALFIPLASLTFRCGSRDNDHAPPWESPGGYPPQMGKTTLKSLHLGGLDMETTGYRGGNHHKASLGTYWIIAEDNHGGGQETGAGS